MSRSPFKRAFAAWKRLVRRKRAPHPSDQEWLRLILLVRRLQRGQLAFAQRLDEIRALTGVVGSFRSDFGALQEQLRAARISAGELERGLSEGLSKLGALPDPATERTALDRRVATLDSLAARLEILAARAPEERAFASDLAAKLERFESIAGRLEALQELGRSEGGSDELAQLYERIQELAEGLTRSELDSESRAIPAEVGEQLARLEEQVAELGSAIQGLGEGSPSPAADATLARIEKLAERMERRRVPSGRSSTAPEELIPLVARLESVALRLEQAPPSLPELPSEVLVPDPASQRELEELRVGFLCEQESRRRLEQEVEALRERLRASELARVELETRHASELSQMADHVGRQLQRVEDDLKKKKRGLSELTQQNIALQNRLNQLQAQVGDAAPTTEPPAALPSQAPRLTRPAPTENEPPAG